MIDNQTLTEIIFILFKVSYRQEPLVNDKLKVSVHFHGGITRKLQLIELGEHFNFCQNSTKSHLTLVESQI